jgi:signal transduction histidine kinase
VIDRGVGISAEDQAKVFDDYYRTKEARALGTRGSGLGLSLVRHILQGHGGRVELRSTPGVGSEFSLHFPRPAR